jgi:hypothetical protein
LQIEVGTPIARRRPRRSWRAELPHRAPRRTRRQSATDPIGFVGCDSCRFGRPAQHLIRVSFDHAGRRHVPFYYWKQWSRSEAETPSHRLPVSQGPGHGNTPAVLELHVNARLPGLAPAISGTQDPSEAVGHDVSGSIHRNGASVWWSGNAALTCVWAGAVVAKARTVTAK